MIEQPQKNKRIIEKKFHYRKLGYFGGFLSKYGCLILVLSKRCLLYFGTFINIGTIN